MQMSCIYTLLIKRVAETVIAELLIQLDNMTVTMGEEHFPFQLTHNFVNLCFSNHVSVSCPLAANVPVALKYAYDVASRHLEEFQQMTVRGRVRLFEGNLKVLMCLDVKLDF
jgi:hypothetical protein